MVGVAVLGCGVVGSGVAELFYRNAALMDEAAGCEVRLVRAVDLRDVALAGGVPVSSRFEDALEDDSVNIMVETIGGAKAAYDYTKRALLAGKHVVTSNKELVATYGDELCKIADERGCMYLYEASVGGGIPIMHPLMRVMGGNAIEAVTGIVNGSTNYLLTRMAEMGVSFPAALGEAKRLGYVEGNPAADVEGWDARRKLAILANAAFGSRFADDIMIPTRGISAVTERDMAAAKLFGRAVKLIAHARRAGANWGGWVRPCAVPSEHPLFAVRDVFNGIVVTGDCVGDVMFYGRGAGSLPTASAVAGDIIDAARHIDSPVRRVKRSSSPRFKKLSDERTAYLISAADVSGAREALTAAFPEAELRAEGGVVALITGPVGEAALDAQSAKLTFSALPLL